MEVILVELSNLMLVAVRNMFSEYNSTIRWFNASDTVRTRWSQVTQEEADIPNQYQSARSIFLSKINWPVFIKWHKITFHSAAVWVGGWRSGVKVNRMSEICQQTPLGLLFPSIPVTRKSLTVKWRVDENVQFYVHRRVGTGEWDEARKCVNTILPKIPNRIPAPTLAMVLNPFLKVVALLMSDLQTHFHSAHVLCMW